MESAAAAAHLGRWHARAIRIRLGIELESWHGDTWAFHGGSSPGASGMVALMPAHRFGVAILANLEDLPARNDLVEKITRLALGFESATAK